MYSMMVISALDNTKFQSLTRVATHMYGVTVWAITLYVFTGYEINFNLD